MNTETQPREEGELLPCPFCGASSARVLLPTCTPRSPYNPADRAFPSIRCMGCIAEVPGDNWDRSGISAITAWNTRLPLSAVPLGRGDSSSVTQSDASRAPVTNTMQSGKEA